MKDIKVKKIGIIVEWNPFHNGHKIHIGAIKAQYPEAQIIAAMSGNIVQRGELAIESKFTRANNGLENGVDIVCQIPTYYVLNSADYFAKGAIDTLMKFNVDVIIFGSETHDVDKLIEKTRLLIQNENEINAQLKDGNSLPKIVESIIGKYNSNDTLGISYIKYAIKNDIDIRFETIKRESSEVNKKTLSASEIRNRINKKKGYKKYVPNKIKRKETFDSNVLIDLIKYELIKLESATFSFNDEINYLIKNRDKINDFDSFRKISTKQFTASRLRRTSMKLIFKHDETNKVKILGFQRENTDLIRNINNIIVGFDKNYLKDLNYNSKIINLYYPKVHKHELSKIIKK